MGIGSDHIKFGTVKESAAFELFGSTKTYCRKVMCNLIVTCRRECAVPINPGLRGYDLEMIVAENAAEKPDVIAQKPILVNKAAQIFQGSCSRILIRH